MNETQHDLSSDGIRLDYMAMLETAQVAYYLARNEVSRYLDQHLQEGYSNVYADAFVKAAHQVRIAGETMHVLTEGLTRGQLEVVNKPPITTD